MTMLAPDVVWTADSGGKASAARRPVVGAEKVARLIIGPDPAAPDPTAGPRRLSTTAPGAGALPRRQPRGRHHASRSIDGKISNFYAMRNPEKLAAVTVPRQISR